MAITGNFPLSQAELPPVCSLVHMLTQHYVGLLSFPPNHRSLFDYLMALRKQI